MSGPHDCDVCHEPTAEGDRVHVTVATQASQDAHLAHPKCLEGLLMAMARVAGADARARADVGRRYRPG